MLIKVAFFIVYAIGFQANDDILNLFQCNDILACDFCAGSSLGCRLVSCVLGNILFSGLNVISKPTHYPFLTNYHLQCKTKSTSPKKRSSKSLVCQKPHSTGSCVNLALPAPESCSLPLMPKNYGVRCAAKPTGYLHNMLMRQIET